MTGYNKCEANLTAPIEDKPVFYCSWCDKPIYENDDYYNLCGEHVCQDCIDNCMTCAAFEDDEEADEYGDLNDIC